MIKQLNYELAAALLVILSSILILFHFANILGLIPVNVVWTGRIASESTMLVMGIVSIILNGVIILCAVVRLGLIRNKTCQHFIDKLLPFVFWWLVGNTIANLFSKSSFEVFIFTPILVVLTICIYRIKMNHER